MQGDANNFFRPDENLTWKELIQTLWAMEGNTVSNSADNSWYENAVNWVIDQRLLYEEDINITPETAVTREELFSVLYLYAQKKGIDTTWHGTASDFTYRDASNISAYAVDAVKFADEKGFINGGQDHTVNPKASITRAEAAVVVEKFMKLR